MTQESGTEEQTRSARAKRPARFAVAALGLPILGALVCAIFVPGERRAGEMFSMGLLVCLVCSVGGAIFGFICAFVAMIRRESPAVLSIAALLINAAIVIYAYS